jgi:hypothetical protein
MIPSEAARAKDGDGARRVPGGVRPGRSSATE